MTLAAPSRLFQHSRPDRELAKESQLCGKRRRIDHFPASQLRGLRLPSRRAASASGWSTLFLLLAGMYRTGFCLPGPHHTVGQADRSTCYSSPF